jgi:hypothetical protein
LLGHFPHASVRRRSVGGRSFLKRNSLEGRRPPDCPPSYH